MTIEIEQKVNMKKKKRAVICCRTKLVPHPSTEPMPRSHALCPNPRSCLKPKRGVMALPHHGDMGESHKTINMSIYRTGERFSNAVPWPKAVSAPSSEPVS